MDLRLTEDRTAPISILAEQLASLEVQNSALRAKVRLDAHVIQSQQAEIIRLQRELETLK